MFPTCSATRHPAFLQKITVGSKKQFSLLKSGRCRGTEQVLAVRSAFLPPGALQAPPCCAGSGQPRSFASLARAGCQELVAQHVSPRGLGDPARVPLPGPGTSVLSSKTKQPTRSPQGGECVSASVHRSQGAGSRQDAGRVQAAVPGLQPSSSHRHCSHTNVPHLALILHLLLQAFNCEIFCVHFTRIIMGQKMVIK